MLFLQTEAIEDGGFGFWIGLGFEFRWDLGCLVFHSPQLVLDLKYANGVDHLVRSHCLFICRPLTKRRRELNPGRLGGKHERFLCTMPSPMGSSFIKYGSGVTSIVQSPEIKTFDIGVQWIIRQQQSLLTPFYKKKTLPWPNLGRLVTQPLPTVPQILFYFFSNLMSQFTRLLHQPIFPIFFDFIVFDLCNIFFNQSFIQKCSQSRYFLYF